MLPYPLNKLTQSKRMNAHLALQARLHDLEECEKKTTILRSADTNEKNSELEAVKASAEAEIESEEVHEENGRGTTEVDSDSGEASPCMSRGTEVHKEDGEGKESGAGGHTPGEVWTESPHFLWGP
jgi:hypothetical protein